MSADLRERTDPQLPDIGSVGLLRWAWRQLTSMRTALVLLFLLALASIPGSVLPQRPVDPAQVRAFEQANPTLADVYDALGLFDVFGSVWFAAIYLLLMVSLVGCVLPRAVQHYRAMRAAPPATPRNLARLPEHRQLQAAQPSALVLDDAEAHLRDMGFRIRTRQPGDDSVSAEKGYTKETGNLLFHLSLIVVLVGVAVGALFSTRGGALITEGEGFANTVPQYDEFDAGRWADEEDLPPFAFTMTDFRAEYIRGGSQDGQPSSFEADLLVRDAPGEPQREVTVQVNQPLRVDGASMYLIGHGYSPVVRVRDGDGRVVVDGPVPFLPVDADFTSDGVIKAPDARPEQLAFTGLFLPTASIDPELGPISTYPAADDPRLFLAAWIGDLGLDTGKPQNVYSLDTEDLERVDINSLAPGDVWELPDGLGSIEFVEVREWASFQIASDPGQLWVLIGVVAAMIGLVLSVSIRRRRIWVRATESDGATVVEVAGLTRTEGADLPEVDELAAHLQGERSST